MVRAYLDNAKKCSLVSRETPKKKGDLPEEFPMKLLDKSGFFEVFIPRKRKFFKYFFRAISYDGLEREVEDAYRFLPTLSDDDIYLIGRGDQRKIYKHLGSQIRELEGVKGVSFAVWAPTARRVSVVGDFNKRDGRYHQMRLLGASGIWEIFIPNLNVGAKYKYEILSQLSETPFLKTDPYALRMEPPPYNDAVVYDISDYEWGDSQWIKNREKFVPSEAPLSIYEVHLGSWIRTGEGDDERPLSYLEIAPLLAEYCKKMNFTHVEFMPLSEYPFEGSWGYQVTGFYAPTFRYGMPHEFMSMIDTLHQNGIGVIMDWVPAHFPRDIFALAQFDGSHLYEHEDPRKGANIDWGTLCFNYGRNEVSNFLMGSALAWFDRFHIDGLRVDAVASMLYLNYSRRDGEWVPNEYGGAENLEAIEFIRRTNDVVHETFKGSMMIAEESTTFQGVTRPTSEGGLGFDLKWNLGWMHDTLDYMKEDPVNRKFHHNSMTFPSAYQFTEKFVSVYSHDEVVHGKSPMVGKMGGAYWGDKIANLRALYAYMWMWPGKKTLFMGDEFAQTCEWRYDESLEWHLLEYEPHKGVQSLVRDVAGIYLNDALLAKNDAHSEGFKWINANDGNNSIFSFLRYTYDGKTCYATVSNFTPIERRAYVIGLPIEGVWREILNTDSKLYGGGNRGNAEEIRAQKGGSDGMDFHASIVVPPMSTLIFKNVK